MYKIARLVLSEKNIHKDKKNNMMRKCIILSSKEPHLFIKCKKDFAPSDIYIKIKFENNKFIEWTQIGTVGNKSDDLRIFYHLFTANWITNKKLNKLFENYLKDNITHDNAVDRKIYDKLVITVDPSGATDLDDGFTFYQDDEFFNLDIHIADPVSYFVQDSEFSSIVLEEICKRVSTCYIDESCHLLPESFVNNVSFLLKDNSYKRSMSFIFKINKTTLKVDFSIKLLKLVNIKNATYDSFQSECDADIPYKNNLYQLSLVLINIMGLNYDKNFLEDDYFSHKIIEIFMLWTNYSVGNYLYDNSEFFIARTQEQFCEPNELVSTPEYVTSFLNYSASYNIINSSNKGEKKLTHFALGIENYTHISSPMRRVIDFINHIIIYNNINNSESCFDTLFVKNLLSKLDIDFVNETIRHQKKVSSAYQIIKEIEVNNIFNACILNFKIINDNKYAMIVVYNKQNNFKKILDVEIPINSIIKLEKFFEFKIQLFYNPVNYKSNKFPFSIKII